MLVKCSCNSTPFKVDNVFFFTIKGDIITMCSGHEMIDIDYKLDHDAIITCEAEEYAISVNMTSVDGIINRFGPYKESVSLSAFFNEFKINSAYFKNCYSIFVDEYVL